MPRHAVLTLALALTVTTALAEPLRPARRVAAATSTPRLLNQRLPEVRCVDQPFDQVLEWLSDYTHLNIVPRWQVLADAGVKRDKPVTLSVKNLRLTQVLNLIMVEAAGPDLVLAYRASGNLLLLSTADDLGREIVTRVYDVSDLLNRAPSSGLPNYQASQGLQTGQGGSIMPTSASTAAPRSQPADNALEQLVRIIQNTVEPDTWRANGGSAGQIEVFGNLLIVRNTILAHQQLAGFLTETDWVGP